jgi:hypothetical protein
LDEKPNPAQILRYGIWQALATRRGILFAHCLWYTLGNTTQFTVYALNTDALACFSPD